MNGPNKITIGRANIRSNGDVVFCWVENSVECEAIRKDIQYIRKDALTEYISERKKYYRGLIPAEGAVTFICAFEEMIKHIESL